MRTRIVSSVVALALALALVPLAACKHAADLGRYKEQAMAVAAQYAPQVKELLGKTDGLAARVKALPVTVPGLDQAAAALESNRAALARLQGLLDQLPGKTADAIKTGDQAKVEAVIASTTSDVATGVVAVGNDVATAETEVAALEAKAKALAAAAPGYATTLASGVAIAGNADGIEGKLIGFLADAARPVDKTTWFDFDRLTFAAGGAELDMAGSQAQLTNIAEILKAFPAATLKVGGYTDNTGAAAANQQLSLARAKAVVAALVALGVDGKRLEAEGYGAEHPLCPANDTDACKAQNRRIAVRVTAK